jgi:DNA segregation ATPase FtsK/SpoIIIE, S-DNA-T family
MGARAFVPRSLSNESESDGARRRVFDFRAEVAALLFVAGAVFLALALGSFAESAGDPLSGGADWMGEVGAFVARILAVGFGGAAWLVPLELVLLSLPLFRGLPLDRPGLRVAGDAVILVLLSALLDVLLPNVRLFGDVFVGGNVGVVFGELGKGLFSTLGSMLVTLTGIVLILVGRASFSFVEGTRRTWRLLEALMAVFKALAARGYAAWVEARTLSRALSELRDASPDVRTDLGAGSASIFFDAPDMEAWVPCEKTGRPPLTLISSFRHKSPEELEEDFWSRGLGDSEPIEPQGALGASEADAASGLPVVQGKGWEILGSAEDTAAPEVALGPSDDADVFDDAEVRSEADLREDESPEFASLIAETNGGAPAPKIVDTTQAQATQRVKKGREPAQPQAFKLPSPALLVEPESRERTVDRNVLLAHAARLERTLLDYGVTGKVEEIHPGPTVTTYEVLPSAGTKVSKVASLADDLALGLSRKVRIVAPIPGKGRIGFELPNDRREAVYLRDLIEDSRFQELARRAPLPVVLGRDIIGAPFYADLASMPHVIVAGATGAGKSVGLNVMLSSLLFCRTPEQLRLLMIDPKVVELAPFDRIPHLLLPVVTDMKQAATALRWAVDEMERRYQLFADAGTKNITTYNRYVERVQAGELPAPRTGDVLCQDGQGGVVSLSSATSGSDGVIMPEALPFIVIVVDEFADLMMQQGKEVEVSIARLAQKARAAGMHVILATQRPSVDVITGMIKANFPTRIAFRVAQKVDSRTILDEQGAEVLLGRGDMLVKLNGAPDTVRVQCPYVSEEEVSALTDHLRAEAPPRYQDAILATPPDDESPEEEEKVDGRFEEAVLIVRDTQRCSTSWLQRKMTIGYNRAAKIVELMEKRGYVGPPNGSKDREVLLPP